MYVIYVCSYNCIITTIPAKSVIQQNSAKQFGFENTRLWSPTQFARRRSRGKYAAGLRWKAPKPQSIHKLEAGAGFNDLGVVMPNMRTWDCHGVILRMMDMSLLSAVPPKTIQHIYHNYKWQWTLARDSMESRKLSGSRCSAICSFRHVLKKEAGSIGESTCQGGNVTWLTVRRETPNKVIRKDPKTSPKNQQRQKVNQ